MIKNQQLFVIKGKKQSIFTNCHQWLQLLVVIRPLTNNRGIWLLFLDGMRALPDAEKEAACFNAGRQVIRRRISLHVTHVRLDTKVTSSEI